VFSKILPRFLSELHTEFDGKEDITISQIDAIFTATLKKIKEIIKSHKKKRLLRVLMPCSRKNLKKS